MSTREVVQSDSFHYVDSQPQTWQVFSSLFSGFCDKADIIIFILMVGGAFWILNNSHAIDIGVMAFLKRVQRLNKYRIFNKIGVENIIISLIMILFSLFGAVFGMSEETIAFVVIFVPLAISMGYDSIVGVCMCYMAAHIGFAGAMLNPFTIGIAQGIGYGKFEYKNNRIYWEVIGGEIEFRKSTREHPLCEEHLELLQKGYENSLIAEPLKLGDIHYFEETNIPSDKVENSLFCIEITNPNPFRVYFPELVYYRADGTKGIRIVLQYVEAESTIVYVGLDSDRVYDFSDDCCEIHYNPYNTRYKGQEATVVVTDRSKVVTDNNGLVTGVTVETRGEAGSEQINGDQIRDSYFLNVVFYKDNEIVGCGHDVFSQLDVGKTNTIKYFSPVTDYDYYEIYAT